MILWKANMTCNERIEAHRKEAELAIKYDRILAEAIAMVHCNVDDFNRWNRAFWLLRRSIRDKQKQDAALEVLLDWNIPNTGSVLP